MPLKDGVLVQTQSPSITYGPCRSALSAMSWFQRGKLRRHVDNMFSGASVFNADLGRWKVRQSRRWPLCSTTRTRSTKALGVGIWSVGAHMPELWGPSAHACFHRLPLTPRGVHVHVHVHRATVLFARHLHLGRLTSHCSDCGHGTAQVREWQRPTHRCPTRGHSALLQHALAFVTADACDSAGSCAAVQRSTVSCSAHRLAED